VITAAGPFTTTDNLNYEPLTDLMVTALKTKPDLLILIGPFVDVSQPLLSNGQVTLSNSEDDGTHEASFEMVFVEKIVRDHLFKFFETDEGTPTNIILIPSLLDAHHEFVFPQVD
jgi:DNA polymerase alpha subunit B